MSGRISRSFINELISRIDLIDLIDSYLSLRKAGQNYLASCPFHDDKTPSFTVSPEKQFYYCFGCSAQGNAISFLMNYSHLEFVEAVHELAARVGMEVVYEQGHTPTAIASQENLYNLMSQTAKYYQQQLRHSQAAITYLKERGLTGEIARDFGLGYAPLGWHNLLENLGNTLETRNDLLQIGLIKKTATGYYYDRFRDRIMFPILDRQGRTIAFGGRLLHESAKEPKYLNSPETVLFQKGRELYGWYLARQHRPLQRLLVVEGYMDVVLLAQHGLKNVVATLGTAVTHEHLTRLFRAVPEILFCFDGDPAGQKAAWRALEMALPFLQEGQQVRFVLLPPGHDPDSFVRQAGISELNRYLENALPLSKFFFDTLIQQVDISYLDGRARLVELAKPLLKQLPMSSYRVLMIQQLSELTRLDSSQLTTLIPNNNRSEPIAVEPIKLNKTVREYPLIHQAIIYLLHKPILSQQVAYPNEKLSSLQQVQSDIKLLLQLIEITKKNPQITLGAICEHWRGTEYEEVINRLASQQALFINSHINIDNEFIGAINRLYEDYEKQQWELLLSAKQSHNKL